MGRLVDQAVATLAAEANESTEGTHIVVAAPLSDPADPGDQTDIEAELYCSTREMGISPVGFGPIDDA